MYDRSLERLLVKNRSQNVLFYGQNNYFETPRTNIRSSIPPCTFFLVGTIIFIVTQLLEFLLKELEMITFY